MPIVAISADTQEQSASFIDDAKLPFPVLHDDHLQTALAYGVAMKDEEIAVPSVFLIAADSEVLWRHVGENKGDRPTVTALLERIDAMPSAAKRPKADR